MAKAPVDFRRNAISNACALLELQAHTIRQSNIVESTGRWSRSVQGREAKADYDRIMKAARALRADLRIYALARVVAEWHIGDGDECGKIARRLLSLLDGSSSGYRRTR